MRLICLFVLLFLQGTAYAFNFNAPQSSFEPSFLKAQDAFQLSFDTSQNGKLVAHWNIANGYYLYQSRISLSGPQADKLEITQFPDGEHKTDPYFGKVIIYKHSLFLPISYKTTLAPGTIIHAKLHYQGCADKGLCYPPQTVPIEFTVPKPIKGQPSAQSQAIQNSPVNKSDASQVTLSQANSISQTIMESSFGVALFAVFVFGLLLSFTPCVLPMVPIVSAIVVGTRRSRLGAFYYSAIYVLAMALTYSAIGALAGAFGIGLNLQAQLQSPIILSISAALFILLALSMFGVFELRLPAAWQTRLQQTNNNRHTSVSSTLNTFLAGVLATLVVSPCLSAPMAGVLLYISSQGDIWYGALILFVMGLGMGIPLLLVGLFGAKILPKSGPWLNDIKAIMGFGLLSIAIWLLVRWLPASIELFLWGALALGIASYFWHQIKMNNSHPVRWFFALLFTFIGAVELYGGTTDANSPLTPIKSVTSHQTQAVPFKTTIHNLSELQSVIDNGDTRPIVLDVYADWCISCQILEHEIFQAKEIQPLLKQVQLVRVDVTDNTKDNKAFMKHFHIFGPPALLFINAQGQEQKSLSLIGEPSKQDVLTRLKFVTN
ncbi:Thiol:disulfide interchange protein DsbD precursor [Marinomonas spartinae]|uniref:Thiol:disulfide interchange protein DsbD n=1 Tax=Marinomonas spartinae TaxID=1792290 RepID=A0A1A8TG14_9GAMM|nr:protein-disulfide reductase DsbD [Marinomonas spartinae]SBS30884.1 Thiol:disulfide interchange protein DsbD precursor [Marinomonas spartinae]SBS33302.1 Thiol:disulfide interchange protein DsbD precursor [Marinomonas spartinae]